MGKEEENLSIYNKMLASFDEVKYNKYLLDKIKV